MTAGERFALILEKLKRAEKHIFNLEREIQAFLDSEPYKVGTKPNSQFPDVLPPVYYLASARVVPVKIALIAGDAIQNLRSSLDHLAWHLVDIGQANLPAPLTESERKRIGFPITDTDSPAEYEASRRRKVKGMTQAAIDAIDKTKPYKGGNDALWKLSQLNNIDKHRLLITVGAHLAHFAMPTILKRMMITTMAEKEGLRIDPNADISGVALNVVPDDRKCPLKEGDELLPVMRSFLEKNEEMKFTFDIVFNEPGVAECKPILPTLIQTFKYVADLIVSFKPLLS
jgi:hypothetical protein